MRTPDEETLRDKIVEAAMEYEAVWNTTDGSHRLSIAHVKLIKAVQAYLDWGMRHNPTPPGQPIITDAEFTL